MKFTTSTYLYAALIVVILGAGYWYFFTGTTPETPVTSSSANTDPAVAQFLGLIGELGPIHFDKAIFSDPRFTSLVDIGTAVTPEATGRHDFFAPIGSQ